MSDNLSIELGDILNLLNGHEKKTGRCLVSITFFSDESGYISNDLDEVFSFNNLTDLITGKE